MTVVINPDDFLETPTGRVWTASRSAEAWRQAFGALEQALSIECDAPDRIIIVCGLQGVGKSTWIGKQVADRSTLYFDAALPAARHRKPIVEIARDHGVKIDAVWVRAQLATVLERNQQRPADKIVPEDNIRSVDRLFEPPLLAEGFTRVSVIDT